MSVRLASPLLVLSAVLAMACTGCTSSSGGNGSTSDVTTPISTPAASTPASNTPSTPAPSTTPTTPAASSSTASTRPASWCVDGEITVAETGNPEGSAAGHNSVVLTFTNSSTRTCVLYGYPGADAINATGHVVAHAKRSLTGYIGGMYSGLHNVSLHPGQVASTILEGDIGDGLADCVAGVNLVVTAPNLFHSSPLAGAPYVCDFTIHPVVAGSTGR